MPNWCEVDMTVENTVEGADDLERFLNGLNKNKEDGYDILSTYHPIPDELANTISPRTVVKDEAEKAEKIASNPGSPQIEMLDGSREITRYITEAESKELIGKYGANDWYDWCNPHWGSKWGDCRTVLASKNGKKLEFEFESPWSPPTHGFMAISEKFPNLVFTLRYYECGMGFQGEAKIQNGKIISQWSGDYNGDRGG